MSEANKAVAVAFFEALGSGDAARLDALLTDDAVAICTGTGMLSGSRSRAELLGAAGMLAQLAPGGIAFKLLTVTAEADRVAVEVEGKATLVNGAAYNNQYHFLLFLRDGKVFRMKEYMDSLLVETVLVPLVRQAA